MNQTIRRILIVIGLMLVAYSHAHAGEVTIPNTFSAGTPAVADEVNANFAAVETAVDDNAANISDNAADILSSEADITANSSAISANASAIAAHADSITTHQSRLAAAHGFVNQHYLGNLYGSDNIASVTWNGTENRYEIEFDERFWAYYYSCSVAVTPYGISPRLATTSASGSGAPILYVRIFDLDGNPVQGSFHWVMFVH